jgi:hypothetical protein
MRFAVKATVIIMIASYVGGQLDRALMHAGLSVDLSLGIAAVCVIPAAITILWRISKD